jgi:hypothetical protein
VALIVLLVAEPAGAREKCTSMCHLYDAGGWLTFGAPGEGCDQLHLEVELIRHHCVEMSETADSYNFKCPKLECAAEYVAIHRDYVPDQKPRCSECGTPFLAMENGKHLHYQTRSCLGPGMA